ncbi:MAG: hypothetical protein DIZ78_09475 [endosymbiont of Escarpia spicata]|uniref:HTH cro/C1-type domain-containing protein n=1 Tax=endosymbiont of Escarpia spicata TaxID=2200908 RepID=A0A370DN94_9GAMM|nr:MAG: hypothetical protein DIZ78_09475 [endosymbiont of Escarpia spicata]
MEQNNTLVVSSLYHGSLMRNYRRSKLISMEYGERLKKARKHKGWTQEQLSECSGVKQGTISKIERGDQETSTFNLQLATALGISPHWLDREEGSMLDRHIVVSDHGTAIEEASMTAGVGASDSGTCHDGESALTSPVSSDTIASLLDRLSIRLQSADDSVRDKITGLMMNYLDNPAGGERIAKAIEVLLGEEDSVDPPP